VLFQGVAVGSRVPESTLAPPLSFPIKVSSISTTNENKCVSITRSDEVTGKSSTDGSSSTAGKPGSLSIDALAKAKKALQLQKELAEKLKRIPQVNCLLFLLIILSFVSWIVI
jgi:U4/U6 small nuclear ribonucleoprotein PRP3